jgi:hypothetical protein
MTPDQIIQWAREATKHANKVAGFPERTDHAVTEWTTAFNTRFAQLVASHKQEQCAQECDAAAEEWRSPKYHFATSAAKQCAAAIRALKD